MVLRGHYDPLYAWVVIVGVSLVPMVPKGLRAVVTRF
jgi:hypothetical protein